MEVHGQIMIWGSRTSTSMSSWGSEEARGMDITRLPMRQSSRPPLSLCLRCEQGERAWAQPYAIGRTTHNITYRNYKLCLTYSSFIDYYISFLCIIVIVGQNITDSARRREEATWGVGGEDDGQADALLADQQRMAEMFQHMQCLGIASGFAPPYPLFPPADPTYYVLYSCEYQNFSHVWYY
jgi:hypothetical protein